MPESEADVAEVKLNCRSPECLGPDVWARYRHEPCAEWEEPAMGPEPDGLPSPRECRGGGCLETISAHEIFCKNCHGSWPV